MFINKHRGKFVYDDFKLKWSKPVSGNKDATYSIGIGNVEQQYKQFYKRKGVENNKIRRECWFVVCENKLYRTEVQTTTFAAEQR